MRKIQGYGYRFGRELHVSFDPIVGGWPLELEVDEKVELVEVTRHEPTVKGSKLSTRKLVEMGLLRAADQAEAEAAWKASRQEEVAKKAAARAQDTATKALERAKEAAAKAQKIADAAQEKAKLIAASSKIATPPKKIGQKSATA